MRAGSAQFDVQQNCVVGVASKAVDLVDDEGTVKYQINQTIQSHDSMYTEDTVAIVYDIADLRKRVARLEPATT